MCVCECGCVCVWGGGGCECVVGVDVCMNNHIYSTLFKTQERESDRRSKEIEQRNESQKTHTNKTTRTCDPKS